MPSPKKSRKMEKTQGKSVYLNHVEMQTIFDYMKTGKYPPGIPESEKRNLRKRSKSFQICDDRLYFIPSDVKKDEDCGIEDPENITNKRLVLYTMEERIKAINEAHVDAKGNHLGREKVSSIISEKYYWVGISKMIRDFIRKCALCQVSRSRLGQVTSLPMMQIDHSEEDTSHTVEVGSSSLDTQSNTILPSSVFLAPAEDSFIVPKIEHLPEPVAFWETVEMCIYGPFVSDGNDHYVFVFMDAYSYWPEAFVSDTVTSSVITQLILCLVSRFGVMQKFVFKDTNKFDKEKLYPSPAALRAANIDIAFKSIGCQETDGTWQEISEMITNFIMNNSHWMNHLEFVLLPHRISRSNRADYTPSFLTYGREINLPTQLSHRNEYQGNLDPHLTFDQKVLTVNCLIEAYEIHINEATLQQQAADETNKQTAKKKKGKKKQNIKNETEDEDNVIQIGDVIIQETSPTANITETQTNERDKRPTSSRKRKLKNVIQEYENSNNNSNISTDNLDLDSESEDEVLLNEDEPFEHNYANSSTEKVNIDMFYEAVMLYVTKKKYPPQSGEHFKRIIRKAHTQYKVEGSKLYIMGDKHCIEVPAKFDERLKLLKSTHKDELGKHHSKKFMVDKLSGSYVWKGLTLDCEAFVQACPDCKFGRVRNMEDTYTKTKIEEMKFEHYRENEESLAKEAEHYYAQLFSYLQKEKLPPNSDTKAVKRLAKNFVLENSALCYKRDPDSNSRSLELSSRERRKAIKEAHDKELHVSVKETLENLSMKYLWCGMKNDVESFIKNCCKKKLPNPKSKQALLKKRYTTFKLYMEQDRGEDADKNTDENGRKKSGQETDEETPPKKKTKRNNYSDGNAKRNNKESGSVIDNVTIPETGKMNTAKDIRVHKIKNVKSVRDIVENQQNKTSDEIISVQNQPNKDIEQESEHATLQNNTPDKASMIEYYNDIEMENYTEISLGDSISGVNKESVSSVSKHGTGSNPNSSENQNVLEPEPLSSEPVDFVGSVDKDISETVISSSENLSKSVETKMPEPVVMVTPNNTGNNESMVTIAPTSAVDNDSVVTVTPNSPDDDDISEPVKSIHVFSTPSGEILLMESEAPEDEIQLHLNSKTEDVSQSSGIVSEIDINAANQPQNVDILQTITSSASYQPQNTNILTMSSSSDPVTAVAVNSILPESEQLPMSDIGNAQGEINVSQVTSSEELRELQQMIELEPLPVTPQTPVDISDSKADEDYINSSGSEDEEEEDVEDEEEDDDGEKKEVIEEKQIPYMMPNEQRGPAAFRCHICNKRVRGSVKFKVHMYKHTGVKPFDCQYCGKKFTNPKSQKLHIRKHTGVKPYLCNICGKDFTWVGSLRSHIKIHEKGGNIQVKCHVCDRIFASKNRYERHMKYKHPPEPFVFACEPCEKTFTTARSLKRHNQSHHLHQKDHQCDTCGKRFYRKEYLNSHRLQHEQGTIPRQPRRPKPITHVQNEMQLSSLPYSASPHTMVDSQIAVSQSVLDQDIGGGYYTITTETGEDDQPVMHTLVYNYPAVEYEVECGSSANEQLDAEALSAINLLAQASANQGY